MLSNCDKHEKIHLFGKVIKLLYAGFRPTIILRKFVPLLLVKILILWVSWLMFVSVLQLMEELLTGCWFVQLFVTFTLQLSLYLK